ncbi:MAG: hypothetical protein GY729_04165 [Desulfobacteraceae bacterium]|nr:hypothetical protein [Desulfobacteraceae bacterium]
MLASPNLANEQHHIFSMESTPGSISLASGYGELDNRLTFLGVLGSFFLLVGFLFQVAGLELLLSVPPELIFTTILLSLLFSIYIFYKLLKLSPLPPKGQSKIDKSKIID